MSHQWQFIRGIIYCNTEAQTFYLFIYFLHFAVRYYLTLTCGLHVNRCCHFPHVSFDRQTSFSLSGLKSRSIKPCQMNTAAGGSSCNTCEAPSAALVTSLCHSASYLLSHLSFHLSVFHNDYDQCFIRLKAAVAFPGDSFYLSFIDPVVLSYFLTFFTFHLFSLPLPLPLCWGACKPQMPFRHPLLKPLHLQPRAAPPPLPRRPWPPTLEPVGDCYVCVCCALQRRRLLLTKSELRSAKVNLCLRMCAKLLVSGFNQTVVHMHRQ